MVVLQFDPILRKYRILKDDLVIDCGNTKDFHMRHDLQDLLERLGIDCLCEFVNLSE